MSITNGTSADQPKQSKITDDVPFKTIIATIVLVVITYLSWIAIKHVANILELIFAAAFAAIALNPAVDWLTHKGHMRRSFAATIVFLIGATAFIVLMYLFVHPLYTETTKFIDDLPRLLNDAKNGEGTIGDLVQRYNVEEWVTENSSRISDSVASSFGPALNLASTVATAIFALITVLVLAFLMLLEGPSMVKAPLVFFKKEQQERIIRVTADCTKAVSGYVAGIGVIATIAGLVTFITLTALDVPFAVVLSVWVAFTAFIPLVGATLGAIPTVFIAFLHDTTAGFIALAVYIIYQQVENNLLQPQIMSRAVKMNPLAVLISILLGVQLAGFLGALFAIPVAAVIQVIVRDFFDQHKGGLKAEPTVGPEEIPLSQISDDPAASDA